MGLGRIEETKIEQPTGKIAQAIQKILQPVKISSREYYRLQPRKFLELASLTLFGLLTFIGELWKSLPIWWYLIFMLLIVGYYSYWKENDDAKNHASVHSDKTTGENQN